MKYSVLYTTVLTHRDLHARTHCRQHTKQACTYSLHRNERGYGNIIPDIIIQLLFWRPLTSVYTLHRPTDLHTWTQVKSCCIVCFTTVTFTFYIFYITFHFRCTLPRFVSQDRKLHFLFKWSDRHNVFLKILTFMWASQVFWTAKIPWLIQGHQWPAKSLKVGVFEEIWLTPARCFTFFSS